MDRRLLVSVFLTTLIVLIIPIYFMFEPQREFNFAVAEQNESVERGAALFAANCTTCHGVQGQGNAVQPTNGKASGAPPLRGFVTDLGPDGKPEQIPWTKSRSEDYIRATISAGRPPLGGHAAPGAVVMPTWSDRFGGPLRDIDIDYLVAFLESQRFDLVPKAVTSTGAPALPAAFASATPAPPVTASAVIANPTPGPAGSGIVSIETGAQPFKEGDANAGKEVFTTKGCTGCHTIEGVQGAVGTVGPNLTHIASQPYDSFPNDPQFIKQWINDPQTAKPGTAMPKLGLTDEELNNVVTFLMTLK
ncbi:MAG TPA: cytochrome c [Chloroflexota bacterium]|nr:cytochrome c [Chloroflexota bacterium]